MSSRSHRGLALLLAVCVVPASAQMKTSAMRAAVWEKLDYDRTYFRRVLSLKAQGQSEKSVSQENWANEVRRAQLNVPVLDRLFNERSAYDKGQPVSLPRNDDAFRVYFNLAVMLDMLQASEAGNYKAAVDYGAKLVIKDKKNLGLVRNDESNYYLKLYREFFFQMAEANYRLGRDAEAVKWAARLEDDKDLAALRKEAAQEQQVDPKVERLSQLRTKPVAMMPLTNVSEAKDLGWLAAGVPEVLTNDLIQHTDLVVVDRANLAKVLKEVQLSQAGITGDALAKSVGGLLNAGSLIVGSYQRGKTPDSVTLSLRLVDASSGQALAATEGVLPLADVFPSARTALLKLLGEIQWVDEVSKDEIMAARAPKSDTVRDLLNARLMLASKSADAKALYAKAAKEDPAYAKLFDDLKNEFAGISATLAVMPFVNTLGASDDMWMVHGTGQSLNSDLPKLGFTVVERTELLPLIEEGQIGQVLDPTKAQKVAQRLSADFMVMGSVLRQKSLVRIDARFVDVRSGIITQTVSADGSADDFMGVLVSLTKEIARRFNEKLDEKTLASLMGKTMSRQDFEKYVREQLTKEQLARSLKPTAAQELALEDAPKVITWPRWVAGGAAVLGAAAATVGFINSGRYQQAVTYTDGLLKSSVVPSDQQRLTTARNEAVGASTAWGVMGGIGAGVAAVSLGYLVYDLVAPKRSINSSTTITPLAGPISGGAMGGVSVTF